MRRLRVVLVNALVFLGLVALCAAVGEVVLRASAKPNDASVTASGGRKPRFNVYRPDGVLGYAHRPDWQAVHATDEFAVTVRTNGLGLRGGAASERKDAGVYRVLVLGDSFAFGFGVEDAEAFPAVLERSLAPPPGFARVEVLNAGVAGWSADQYLLYLETRGFALEPDLVLLAVSENDPGDLAWNRLTLDARRLPQRIEPTRRMIDRRGAMRYQRGGPLAQPQLRLPGQTWLADHSLVYHWLRFRLARLREARELEAEEKRLRAEAGAPPDGPIEALAPEDIQRGLWTGPAFQLRYHRYLVDATAAACAQRGVALATLLVEFRGEEPKPDSAAAALRRDCESDPRCVRSSGLLAGADPEPLFFAHDGHWTPHGHERVARALAGWLPTLPR
ncbi:MAG TPA: SGNH/GDSL hydrolase family protein [Myxococcota bacterium]|nr:SGNH/GDSL hydrolase family protein [Myxococcota bacterium]